MFDKKRKSQINKQLKDAGVTTGKGDVFNLINLVNQGQRDASEVEELINQLIQDTIDAQPDYIELREEPLDYFVAGRQLISQNAIDDMNSYMRLPYVVDGALMPDGHRVAENSAPVGSVIITGIDELPEIVGADIEFQDGVVLPEAVGSDISCSVNLTVFKQKVTPEWFESNLPSLRYVLERYSYFGYEMADEELRARLNNYLFYKLANREFGTDVGREVYNEIRGIAGNQFASSGDGNHFAEWVMVRYEGSDKCYLGLLTHFGSRAVGSRIAKAFINEAYKQTELPKGIKGVPLYMNTSLGQDYWKLMQWAGSFAKAGHIELHEWLIEKLAERINVNHVVQDSVYTRHNYAWQREDGTIVHRKGATPAERGTMGVIPATMGHASRIVRGLGNVDFLDSASHGAGRNFSRTQAKQNYKGDVQAFVRKEYGIELIGGDNDEDPRAYKDIEDVMLEQRESVVQVGLLYPMVVRMAEPRVQKRRK